MAGAIPTFYLYGEAHREVAETFVHAEALDDRSRPSEWTILPHSHAELCHVFLISAGGGTVQADGAEAAFVAPCLILVPAMCVHGFTWLDETAGWVLTMAARYVGELFRFDGDLAGLFGACATVPLDPAGFDAARGYAEGIQRELGWSAVGHRSAIDAGVLGLAVLAVRLRGAAVAPAVRGGQAALVARLRARIEERFRLRESVADYARALGVSETALRAACARVAGASPSRLLDDRAVLEARRALIYTNLSVAEVGYAVGFGDPAYFSRFFARRVGVAPGVWRKGKG